MTRCIAIDPGSEQSAVVVYDGRGDGVLPICEMFIRPNDDVRMWLRAPSIGLAGYELVIEKIESYAMAVGATVFDTVWWCGRFWEAWPGQADQLPRREAKLHLCGSMRAGDSNIRQALIDRFGPSREKAIGKKASPGPLYGVKKDLWAALAVAVTWCDKQRLDAIQRADAMDQAGANG